MTIDGSQSAGLRQRLAIQAGQVLACAVFALGSSLLFPFGLPWRLVLASLTGTLFFFLLNRLFKHQSAARISEHYLDLLAFLSSRLSVGETLDKASLNYIREQDRQNLARSDPGYGAALRRMARQISLRGDLDQALHLLLDEYPSPNLRPVLLALPKLAAMGGRLDRFVRDSHQSLLEFQALEREVRAEHSQKIAEAWILALMPFVLAHGSLAMIPVQERIQLVSDPRSQAVYALAYLAACLALVLTVAISRTPQTGTGGAKPVPATRQISSPAWHDWGQTLAKAYQSSPLKRMTLPVSQVLDQSPALAKSYFQTKIGLVLASFLLVLIWFAAGFAPIFLMPIIPLAISVTQDLLLVRSRQRLANQYRIIYPLFFTWLVNGLLSGFSVTRVLREAGELWRTRDPASVLSQDLAYFRQQNEGGRPTYWITDQLALSCPVPEIQSFWHGLARYEREGSSEILNLLVLMAANSRQLLRTGRRQELEENSLRLLLPMMIDLLTVLALAGWPSLSLLIL
ncbi:MAG: hypothetical protein EOM08_03835 [Clostridia bacterium]|nr:hypothetical protein [Clostridia bacterium]NCC75549.1 hypothetical protein [Clostridia bacterium]